MTLGGWITFIIIAFLFIFAGFFIGLIIDEQHSSLIGTLIGIIISTFILFGMLFYYNNTASGARAYKTQESNFNMGIQREVTVFDATGNIIKQYEGKFDVEYDNDRILFDDEKGHRHIIYYPTGTVIIDEVD